MPLSVKKGQKERKETWRPMRLDVPQVLLHSSVHIFGENDQHEEKTGVGVRQRERIQGRIRRLSFHFLAGERRVVGILVRLAKFDLWTALLIPYVIATSCVVIAAGSQFNVKPQSAYVDYQERILEGNLEKRYDGLVNARLGLELGSEAYEKMAPVQKKELKENLSDADKDMAAMLVKRDAFNLAKSLKNLTGEIFSHWIFGIGVLGMALSTIIILMTINGHAICEVMGVPHKGKPFILGALLAGVGVQALA